MLTLYSDDDFSETGPPFKDSLEGRAKYFYELHGAEIIEKYLNVSKQHGFSKTSVNIFDHIASLDTIQVRSYVPNLLECILVIWLVGTYLFRSQHCISDKFPIQYSTEKHNMSKI